MKPVKIIFLFFALLLTATTESYSQTQPVLTNVYVVPPYGSHLSDYYSTSREKLVVTLLNRDLQEPVLEVCLKMTITSSTGLLIQNRPEINYPTISLDAGVPVRLSQEDLAPYFQPQNIIQQGALNQGKLPNGMIEFTFQAIEKYTGKILSTPATGRIWLTSQKPPLLTLPQQNEDIAFREPLNIKFQWLPQHNNVSQIEYEFELRELPNNGAAPQSAFLYSPVIHQERLLQTYLQYNVLFPMLDENKTYGWRVRAIAKDGIDEINMFDNNGYSEIFWFKTNASCMPVTNVIGNVHDYQLDIEWTAGEGNKEYEVQFCNKYEGSGEWTKTTTTRTKHTIYSLQLGATYQYRVGAKCLTDNYIYSNVYEFKMPDTDTARLANCGLEPEVDLSNIEPLQELKVGDVVFIGGGFPMTITKVEKGGNGIFTGEGWKPVRWVFNSKLKMKFENLGINTDYQQISGIARAVYDKKKLEDHTGGNNNTNNNSIKIDLVIDFVIPENPSFEYNEETGEVIVYNSDGEVVGTIELPKNEDGIVVFPVIILDNGGNVYQVDVDEDGNVRMKRIENQTQGGNQEEKEFAVFYNDIEFNNIDTLFIIKGFNRDINLIFKKQENRQWNPANALWNVNGGGNSTNLESFNVENSETNDFYITAKQDSVAKDSVILFVKYIDVDIEQEIIKALLEIKNLKTRFDNLVDSLDKALEYEKWDKPLIMGVDNIYVQRGMHEYFGKPTKQYEPCGFPIFDLFYQIYVTDVLIKEYDGKYDELIKKINSVMQQNSNGTYKINTDFISSVLAQIELMHCTTEADAKARYKIMINNITIQNITTNE